MGQVHSTVIRCLFPFQVLSELQCMLDPWPGSLCCLPQPGNTRLVAQHAGCGNMLPDIAAACTAQQRRCKRPYASRALLKTPASFS